MFLSYLKNTFYSRDIQFFLSSPRFLPVHQKVTEQVHKYFFISYILSDQMYYKTVFELFQKIHLQIYASNS